MPCSQNDSVPVNFLYLCKILSPWTSDEHITGIKDAINQGHMDWLALTVYANRANLAPALRHALLAKRLWEVIPPDLQEYLEEMYFFNTGRNKAIFQHLGEVLCLLNSAGITPLLMKGGAALVMDIYPDPAIRFMMDLDILVPDNMLMQSVSALEKDGYYTPEANLRENECFVWETCKHYLPLVKDNKTAHIELHRKVLCDIEDSFLPTENVWRDRQPFINDRLKNGSFVLMSPTHQIMHCIVHSEMSHGNYKKEQLDLRQLLHFAYLCNLHMVNIDWSQVKAQLNNEAAGPALRAYLYSAEMLLGVVTPLTSEPDSESKQHFLDMIHCHVEGKRTLFRRKYTGLISDEIVHFFEVFSEAGLRKRLPELCEYSVWKLRITFVKILFNRYSTVERFKGYFLKRYGPSASIG